MKIEEQYKAKIPIFAQDAGINISLDSADLSALLLQAVLARADIVFKGDDGMVVYQPVKVVEAREHGRLNIQV